MSLTKQIQSNLDLPPNDFQIFLQKIYTEHPIQICSTLAQMLYPCKQAEFKGKLSAKQKEKERQDRMKLATSFNFLVGRSFKNNEKNPELWEIYVNVIATRPEKGLSQQLGEWKITKILQKSFHKFIQSFQDEFTPIMQSLYNKLNPSHKILLQSVPQLQIDQDTLILFLTETLQEYIELGHNQLRELERLGEDDALIFLGGKFGDYLGGLLEGLRYLGACCRDGGACEGFVNRVCGGEQLFRLVHRGIFINLDQQIDRMHNQQGKMEKVFNFSGSYQKQQHLHNTKALNLQILTTMLDRHSLKSTLAEFDQSKCLHLMQTLVPALISQLSQIKANSLNLNCNEKLTIACLGLIKKSVEFLFMNNFMWGSFRAIFWGILFPLLGLCDQEIRQFCDDPDLFIGQAETLVEKDEGDDDKVESCKTYAAFLLDAVTEHVDGALTEIANWTIQLLQHSLLQKKLGPSLQPHLPNGMPEQALETSLTILQILSSKLKQRGDLLKQIKYLFIECQHQIMELKAIDKTRVLMFLCYNFQDVLMGEGDVESLAGVREQYYCYIAGSIGEDEAVTKACLSFYETYCRLQGSTEIILSQLASLIPQTKSLQTLETMVRTLPQTLPSLPHPQILSLLRMAISRILKDNSQNLRAVRANQVYSNICMLKCMYLVRIVALDVGRLGTEEERDEILGVIWTVFEMFQGVEQGGYGEELVRIFDAVLRYVPVVDGPHFFQFLPGFAQYHKKQKQIGRLFYTYIMLLTKSHNYLTTGPQQQTSPILLEIQQNLLIPIRLALKTRSIPALTLLQYLLLKYPGPMYNHQEIYLKTREFLQLHPNLGVEGRAAVYNLWVIGSAVGAGGAVYELGELDGMDVGQVLGYQGRVFGVAVKAKIGQLCQELKNAGEGEGLVILDKIIYLLKKTIIFLQSQRTPKPKPPTPALEYKIDQLSQTNPNQKLRQTLLHLKHNLSQPDYSYIMGELDQMVSREELKELLEQRARDTRVIYRFRL